ncbi:hypothetical protein HAX54_040125 [Datura stramonium]|uniref:Wall-associated receptor kinase galacturonan-binding domain-containing protein n=1 Tax=Datura stramonium TaxID=4076 RepID=A0ABS8VM74_DATST|nr:hypothetical protein [Datura stramonium]
MVSLNSLSVFLIFYQLMNFHAAQAQNQTQNSRSCPNEFKCGSLGNVKFPFSVSSQPDCGLYTIDCDATPDPRIHLGENDYSILEQRPFEDGFRVLDRRLQDLLPKNSCHTFDRSILLPLASAYTTRF